MSYCLQTDVQVPTPPTDSPYMTINTKSPTTGVVSNIYVRLVWAVPSNGEITCQGVAFLSPADLKTVTALNLKPEPISLERLADVEALFMGFLSALVLVWGAKQLLNLFTGDTTKD